MLRWAVAVLLLLQGKGVKVKGLANTIREGAKKGAEKLGNIASSSLNQATNTLFTVASHLAKH